MSLDDFKWKHFFICLALIISGIFCTIGTVEILTRQGYIYGKGIDTKFSYSMEHFSYDGQRIALSPTGTPNVYEYFTDTILKVDDFDGTKYVYEFYINGHLGYNTEIGAGFITTQFRVDFYNIHGAVEFSSTLHINVEFLNHTTRLRLTCNDGIVAVGYWQRFFIDEGFRLRAETKLKL